VAEEEVLTASSVEEAVAAERNAEVETVGDNVILRFTDSARSVLEVARKERRLDTVRKTLCRVVLICQLG
jgi:hypothetical protein